MIVRLSDSETAILLGATLMHWGIPFHRAVKRELTEDQQAMIDEVSDKLISLRETFQRTHPHEPQEIDLSDEEAALLLRIVEDCLNECGSDLTELRLQLTTGERNKVEALSDRIRGGLTSGVSI